MVLVFSLKRPAYPEYTIVTKSAVLCLDVHPHRAGLLCVGLYDGSVIVYRLKSDKMDLRLNAMDSQRGVLSTEIISNKKNMSWDPIWTSYNNAAIFSTPLTQHCDPCWQVAWQWTAGDTRKFISLEADGCITDWCVEQNGVSARKLAQLKMPPVKTESADPVLLNNIKTSSVGQLATELAQAAVREYKNNELDVNGCCMAFQSAPCLLLDNADQVTFPMDNQYDNEQYTKVAVGTTSGSILIYPTADFTHTLCMWSKAHQLAVYCLAWNPVVPEVLVSCSADWTTKFWAPRIQSCLLFIDLFAPTVEVAWAPYSSSTLALLTTDGRVLLYDLCVSKCEAIGLHQLAPVDCGLKGARLAFNSKLPLLLVGDSHGDVLALKLSPNLRRRRTPLVSYCQ
ncbi:Dynein intermediate chain 1 axonemal [Paragonimus heterotremus]|uniref:Dynein intermediate chain 1 axonemal n=1 Tax=Paragonimus heterotremus TaxID=100268 RepID=A0A8J4WEV7_9TREM|nr:Dynein intermediate chain 1 axonemal [Paragonimus heterotremus]